MGCKRTERTRKFLLWLIDQYIGINRKVFLDRNCLRTLFNSVEGNATTALRNGVFILALFVVVRISELRFLPLLITKEDVLEKGCMIIAAMIIWIVFLMICYWRVNGR